MILCPTRGDCWGGCGKNSRGTADWSPEFHGRFVLGWQCNQYYRATALNCSTGVVLDEETLFNHAEPEPAVQVLVRLSSLPIGHVVRELESHM